MGGDGGLGRVNALPYTCVTIPPVCQSTLGESFTSLNFNFDIHKSNLSKNWLKYFIILIFCHRVFIQLICVKDQRCKWYK